MKVLIVEDDPLHRSYLHEAVNAALPECDTVIEAENGTVGEKLAREHKSAHIVMDLQMASRNGIEAARTIWKERPETRILFWSNYSDEAYVRGVSRIVPDGAAYGYVLKSASDERLKLALRSIFIESQCVIDREVRGLQQKSLGQTNGFNDSEYEILVDIALVLPTGLLPGAAACRCAAYRIACSSFTTSSTSTRPLAMTMTTAASICVPAPSRSPSCANS